MVNLTLSMFLHYRVKLTITTIADFDSILHVRPHNSYCKVWGCLNSSGL